VNETIRSARPAEVARILGLDPKTVGRYARAGRIPFSTTPSGHRRYNINEVRLALASEASGLAPDAGTVGPALLAWELEQIETQLAAMALRVQAFARSVRQYLAAHNGHDES